MDTNGRCEGNGFTEEDYSGAEERGAFGAVGEVVEGDGREGDVRVGDVDAGGDGQGWDEGIGEVVDVDVCAVGNCAFEIEEGAVKEDDVRGGVAGALGQHWFLCQWFLSILMVGGGLRLGLFTVYVLADSEKFGFLLC